MSVATFLFLALFSSLGIVCGIEWVARLLDRRSAPPTQGSGH